MHNAPDVPAERFTAMTRLDHNRAKAQLAHKAGVPVTDVKKMTIWGNHSATQYPDLFHAEVDGKTAAEVVDDQPWLDRATSSRPCSKRGAAVIEARGASSAASAANAAIDHVHDWVLGTAERRLGVDGHPVRRLLRRPRGPDLVVPGARRRTARTRRAGPRASTSSPARAIDASVAELVEERDAVSELGLI